MVRGRRAPDLRYAPLEHHQPAAAARSAFVVLAPTAAAIPVRPPDPLEVIDLEDEEDDDPDERDVPVHASAFVIGGVERNGPFGLFGRRNGVLYQATARSRVTSTPSGAGLPPIAKASCCIASGTRR